MPDFLPDERYLPPIYSEKEIQRLRLERLHFLGGHLLFLLSDGKVLCVPLSVCPPLEAAPAEQLERWQLIGEGRSVVWQVEGLYEHLSLRGLLEHPEAKVADLAGSASPFPPLPSESP